MSLYKRPYPYTWPILAAAAACLLIPALYNSYPLATSDSGAYINNAYIIQMPQDRPIGYSLFIRLASLSGVSLWGVVIVQAIALLFFIQLITRHVLGSRYHPLILLAVALLTGTATSAGWFCGQLMPDIFTPMLLLALCVLFCIPVPQKGYRWLLYVFIWGCLLLHTSNVLISLLVSLVLLVIGWRKHRKDLLRPARVLFIISAAGWITLSTLTAIAGRGFRPSSASHVFIMCRMVENGVLDRYLDQYCETDHYKLCDYRGKLPNRQWDFMWNEDSPLYLTGGWAANEQEYSRIILKSLTRPKYLGMHVLKNSEATLRQLPLIYVGDGLTPLGEPSNLYWKVQLYYPSELKEFKTSLQQTGALKTEWFNVLIVIFALITGTASLMVAALRPKEEGGGSEVLFSRVFRLVLLFLVINAAVTATFSTVVGRFQSRVFWVLPFICMLYLVARLPERFWGKKTETA